VPKKNSLTVAADILEDTWNFIKSDKATPEQRREYFYKHGKRLGYPTLFNSMFDALGFPKQRDYDNS